VRAARPRPASRPTTASRRSPRGPTSCRCWRSTRPARGQPSREPPSGSRRRSPGSAPGRREAILLPGQPKPRYRKPAPHRQDGQRRRARQTGWDWQPGPIHPISLHTAATSKDDLCWFCCILTFPTRDRHRMIFVQQCPCGNGALQPSGNDWQVAATLESVQEGRRCSVNMEGRGD
jgi:hypothetical protein